MDAYVTGLLGIGGFVVGAWAGRGFPLTWLGRRHQPTVTCARCFGPVKATAVSCPYCEYTPDPTGGRCH